MQRRVCNQIRRTEVDLKAVLERNYDKLFKADCIDWFQLIKMVNQSCPLKLRKQLRSDVSKCVAVSCSLRVFSVMECSFQIVSAVVLALLAEGHSLTHNGPLHVWPLGNLSLYNDVIGSRNIQHSDEGKCFPFLEGPKELEFSVLDMAGQPESCFDVNLDGDAPLRDLTIAMYVYPDNDMADISGTLVHYQSEDREIMRIRTLANTFLVSFRDEYGMSAGMMYLVNFLTPQQWNHVVVTRVFQTGRIVVIKDGKEMYNEDDEFSDIISFPHTGKLRLGKSQDPDDEDAFEGNFACVQMYAHVMQSTEVEMMKRFCHPDQWKQTFQFHYERNKKQYCLKDPLTVDEPQEFESIVSRTTITSKSKWLAFLHQFDLQDGEKTSAYLKKESVDQRPSQDGTLIGEFNGTDRNVCTWLCMRVDGCKALWVGANHYSANLKQCNIYDEVPKDFVKDEGSLFYVLVD